MFQDNGMQFSGSVVEPVAMPGVPQEQNKSSKKWVLLGLIFALAVAVVIVVVMIVMNTRAKATLLIQVAPASATVEIDGKKYSNGAYEFNPGKQIRAMVYKDGFVTQVYKFDIEADETVAVATFLTKENNDLSYYRDKNNYDDLYSLWEYFCTYTDVGQEWYAAQEMGIQADIDESNLEGEEKLLYDFLLGE
jgi:hypothetical protein